MSPRGGKRLGSGAKPIYDEPMIRVTVSLPTVTVADLDRQAAQKKTSRSQELRRRLEANQ